MIISFVVFFWLDNLFQKIEFCLFGVVLLVRYALQIFNLNKVMSNQKNVRVSIVLYFIIAKY